MPRTRPEIALFLKMFDEAYDRKAWHGPNLRGSIRGLSTAQAAWRPSPQRHNIWEICLHVAYWKYAVRRRLTGEKRGSFPSKGSNWIRRPVEGVEENWKKDITLLDQEHRRLRKAISRVTVAHLQTKPKGSRYTNAELIYGILSHDLYHAGQVRLLKRLQKEA